MNKLIRLICCVILFSYSPQSFAQLNISASNAEIKTVLKQIEDKSDYTFFYSDDFLDLNRKVTINAQNQSVESILNTLFRNTGIVYSINDKQIALSKQTAPKQETAAPQSVKQDNKVRITGQILDANGEPIIGATAIEKGNPTNGTATDIDGNFTISVAPNAALQISYIGYLEQEIAVAGQTSFQIVLLEDTKQLEEVVVIGYGRMARKDITSSITTIRAEELNKGGVYSTPGQLLQGKVPGLTVTTSSDPNATPSVTLRGASSFRTGAAQEPYYVIDGIPGASIALVAPDDIESIDVLRDASATAIYGSKAANGVIIVTTKRGREGTTNVTYNGYLAIDQVAKRLEMMNAMQHRTFLNNRGLTLSPDNYIDETTDTNWQQEVQRTGISHNHNVSITGGSASSTYSASLNYMNNEGILKGSGMDRIIARSIVNTKTLKERLDLGFSVNGSITNNQTLVQADDGLSVLDGMMYYLPEAPIYNANGSYFENLNQSQYYNPVALINQNQYDHRSKRFQGIGKATLHIIPEVLTFDANAAYQSETINYSQYNDIDSKAALNMQGYALRSTIENIQKSLEMYANFTREINHHRFNAMAGYSWQENNTNDGFQVSSRGFTSDALSYYNMGIGSSDERPNYGNIFYSSLRMISFFGRVNYSFNSKYILQATVRRDGSSAFGKNNRWGTFPSASLAWRMNEESFIKDMGVFDDLKFRVGYGVSGNSLGFDPLTPLVIFTRRGSFYSNGEYLSAIGAARNANPNLRWERTSMFNVGLDFGFFNNRLSGSIEYYNKHTTDLIADYTVPTTKYLVGYMTANVGQINNRGVEFSLNATPVHTRNFSWDASFNISHNKNTVESISNENFTADYFDVAELNAPGQTGSMQQRIEAGRPLGSFYTWKWAGYDENGISLFETADGGTTTQPTANDRFWTGSAQPKLTFGWNNTLRYKNWSMTMFFSGIAGNQVMNATRARLSRIADITRVNALASIADTENPNDLSSHFLSDRYLEKGDYFRLSNLSVAYNFNKFSDYIQNLRIYASCNNVFVLTGYKGLDPEVNLGGLTPGIDNKNFYPKTRTFMIGTSITF